jgi:uncharacterized protein (DUF305 family)
MGIRDADDHVIADTTSADHSGQAAAAHVAAMDTAGRDRGGRPWRVAGLAALLGLALVVGYVARVEVVALSRPGESSPEVGFARDMSAHHAQAVEMALIAYPAAQLPATRAMAYSVATSQQAQIGIMNTWMTDWNVDPTGTGPPMAWMSDGMTMLGPDARMPGMASADDLNRLRAAKGRQVDILFCQLMTAHHLGGIAMIDGILADTRNDQVLTLARSMKANQQADITSMQALLAQAERLPQ